ncbi:hypothetical protein PM082_017998 [Marasmius tenuissimus]|nr:hypothetical protein PM082_017998 [Marasmius tenuissimus]
MSKQASQKTESTTSLIPSGLKSPSQILSWGSKKSHNKTAGKGEVITCPKSESEFAKKAKAHGWSSPSPARPCLSGL